MYREIMRLAGMVDVIHARGVMKNLRMQKGESYGWEEVIGSLFISWETVGHELGN